MLYKLHDYKNLPIKHLHFLLVGLVFIFSSYKFDSVMHTHINIYKFPENKTCISKFYKIPFGVKYFY